MAGKKEIESCCELCANFEFDEDTEQYECIVNLDEDEMASFLENRKRQCPFFRFGDEYSVVRKQN